MTNTFMNAMKVQNNFKRTENGAVAKKSTLSKVYDLFALGGAYRSRTESDVLLLFAEAFNENRTYAMKCLTYLRDIEGQGERRFFRVCLKWLGLNYPEIIKRNMATWIEGNYIRWDDLFVLFDTVAEQYVMDYIKEQVIIDLKACNAGENTSVSLCAKWLPSENTSSAETRHRARKVMTALGLSARDYRKMLSKLRERIKVVERLMSLNRWEEIDFSKLPSRAGLIYRNAFKSRDLITTKYKAFAEDNTTTVNAKTLYPYDVVLAARKVLNSNSDWCWSNSREVPLNDTERLMVNKYWDNLTDYFKGATLNAMVVCDTSGSMTWNAASSMAPIDVAISLALYTAEHAKGPFAGNYISFSRVAKLIETRGVDFVDKVRRIYEANLCENTNLESVFNLVLNTAMQNNVAYEDMPKTLIIVSDMEVDRATSMAYDHEAFMNTMRRKWEQKCGGWYDFPNIVYWNVNARNNTFLEDPKSGVTFVSGCSPVLYEQILKGVTGQELMLEKLNSSRYSDIC